MYEQALASHDLHLAAATAMKLLEGMQVLTRGGIERMPPAASRVSPESNHKQLRPLVLGQITDMMLQKASMYNMPLPRDLEPVRDEIEQLEARERAIQLATNRSERSMI